MSTTFLPGTESTTEAQAPKSRIGDLKLRGRSSPTVLPQTAAKGGESGEGGEPPLPVSNATFVADALDDALSDLPVCDRDGVNRNKLGWYLKRNANRVVDGYELQAAQCTSRRGWRVVRIDTATD